MRLLTFLILTCSVLTFLPLEGKETPLKVDFRKNDGKLLGLNFSPIGPGQKPGDKISDEQVEARLKMIAPYTRWVRVFSVSGGMQKMGMLAKKYKLKLAAGAWIGENRASNEAEIQALIQLGKKGLVDLAIVGSEVLYREDVTPVEHRVYIKRVKQALPNVPVTTADIYLSLIKNPLIVNECDIVLYNSYPYWEGVPIEHSISRFHYRHQRVKAIAHGKPVWISETGWPSGGEKHDESIPSLKNVKTFFKEFQNWAYANEVPSFWFTSYDEAWKAKSKEGEQGAHWGLWNEKGVLKANFFPLSYKGLDKNYYQAKKLIQGAGKTRLKITQYPKYGKKGKIEGMVLHARPREVQVATLVFVGGHWWTKPSYDEALTPVRFDGTWGCHIATHDNDVKASKIGVFLFNSKFTPPLIAGHPKLPPDFEKHAIDFKYILRSKSK